MRLRSSAFATFLVWRLQIGACGVGAYDSYPDDSLPYPLLLTPKHTSDKRNKKRQAKINMGKIISALLHFEILIE